MKITKLTILALLISLLISCASNQNIPEGSEGTYVNGGNTIVLNNDGTFEMNQSGRVMKGEFSIDGDRLTLKSGSGNAYGTYKRGKIIDNEGKVWIKQ